MVCTTAAPMQSYSGEKVLKILLDPQLSPNRVCGSCPSNVTQSATFIIDLDRLKHPDDVKKDEFGRWNYSGSHVHLYRACGELEFEKVSPGARSNDIFQLRRIYCKHPSNSNFQRLLAFVTGMCMEF